jgi:hypothetical protein
VATILTILLWCVVALLLLLAGLLVIPIRLRAKVRTSPDLSYRIEARALGGWAPGIPIADSARPRKTDIRKPKKEPSGKKRRRRVVGGARMLSAAPEFLSGLLGAIHFEHLKLDAEFGLNDPADTGQVYGCLTPLQFGALSGPGRFVSLRPNFERACFAGELDAALHFTIAAFLPPALRFAWRVFGPAR